MRQGALKLARLTEAVQAADSVIHCGMAVRAFRCGLSWCWGAGDAAARISQIMQERYPGLSNYAETFGGSPAVLCAKLPSKVESYNDLSSGIVSFFRVLRDLQTAKHFYDMAQECERRTSSGRLGALPYPLCWLPADLPPSEASVARAYQWYYVAHRSLTPTSSDRIAVIRKERPGIAPSESIFDGVDTDDVPDLEAIIARFNMLQVDMWRWQEFILRFDSPDTLHFAAPDAYLAQQKGIAGRYSRELVDLLLRVEGGAVLFGRRRAAYARLEAAGWDCEPIEWDAPCNMKPEQYRLLKIGKVLIGRRLRPIPRYVWMSPPVLEAPPKQGKASG